MGKGGKKRRRDDGEVDLLAAGRSTRGPPVATTSGRLSGSVANDEWQTCRSSWEAVAPHFGRWRSSQIWMPFYYDGACAEHVLSLGFERVIHRDEDFFERVADARFMAGIDLIWDNPPYTAPEMKEKVLRALASSGKPFAMLLPISVLHVGFVREAVDMRHVQVIVPRRVQVKKSGQSPLPFKYLVWLCYRCELERDLIFVDDEEGTDAGQERPGPARPARRS